MTPFFADGIDFPILLFWGAVVLVPLLAFEVFVEAYVLKKVWGLPWQDLCGLTFGANCFSLLAGIPTKILNSYLSWLLLPDDLPGFFARYPLVAALGSLNYFVITVLIEGGYAFGWLKREGLTLSSKQVWRGMLLANLATYAVLAPLNYFWTAPHSDVGQFKNDTHWTSQPTNTILFVDAKDNFLKSIQANGSGLKTIVPIPTADYLISTDFNICLFRGTNGNLYLYHNKQTNLIWQTAERFSMNQVAFSPSGRYVAYASEEEKIAAVVDVSTGTRLSLPLTELIISEAESVAWSLGPEKFYVAAQANRRFAITIGTNRILTAEQIEGTNAPPYLKCFGRVGEGAWYGRSDWGTYYGEDECGELKATAWSGLASALVINRTTETNNQARVVVSAHPGFLHIGGFQFSDVSFLPGCNELLFEANGYIYLLDVHDRQVGTLVKGERFIQLTERYEKRL